jgi:deoxycytidylate deaminase
MKPAGQPAPVNFAPVIEFPELVFGLAGPIGVDLEYIEQSLCDALKSFGYDFAEIRITEIMQDLSAGVSIDVSTLVASYNSKIDYANALRERYRAKDLLAALAIGAISRVRVERKKGGKTQPTAYLIRQLKTPEEISLLRSVYGRQFVLVSIYGAPAKRLEYLVAKIKIRSRGTVDDKAARTGAAELIERDRKEDNEFGQNLSNAFPRGDVFVDSNDREAVNSSIERFMNALFGSNEISPTKDEYGMYLAKSASLRSSDLSRQIGAALFSPTGEVISLGSNEVPRAGGGTYWTGDPADSRDFRQGHDPNEINKVEIFSDIVARLAEDRLLSKELLDLAKPQDIVERLLAMEGGNRYRDSRVMDLIEFGRIIHAEMSAICDAARNGLSTRGAILYTTTFPCHLCAKHIVASGISKVVYLEPYPKSYAKQLHGDSIQVEDRIDGEKVSFQPFMGISPFRYRDLFEKGKRKDAMGEAQKWKSDPRRPIIDFIVPTHSDAETVVISQLGKLIAENETRAKDVS